MNISIDLGSYITQRQYTSIRTHESRGSISRNEEWIASNQQQCKAQNVYAPLPDSFYRHINHPLKPRNARIPRARSTTTTMSALRTAA